METPEEVILPLKIKHFIELEYEPLIGSLTPYAIAGCDCAIEKALKEYFSIPRVWESVEWCTIQPITNGQIITYSHEEYGKARFLIDQQRAIKIKEEGDLDPNHIIRSLKLTKC